MSKFNFQFAFLWNQTYFKFGDAGTSFRGVLKPDSFMDQSFESPKSNNHCCGRAAPLINLSLDESTAIFEDYLEMELREIEKARLSI